MRRRWVRCGLGAPGRLDPYLGKTGIEAQFRDGATGAVLGECADTQIDFESAIRPERCLRRNWRHRKLRRPLLQLLLIPDLTLGCRSFIELPMKFGVP